jgi:hypothetical protein
MTQLPTYLLAPPQIRIAFPRLLLPFENATRLPIT